MKKKKKSQVSGRAKIKHTKKHDPGNVEEYIPEESVSHIDEIKEISHHEHRPRNLGVMDSLFHLDADWGTSLAYILPLGLALTGRLAPVYMVIIAVIMLIVANGYKVVCKHNPDGGGVYSSLKKVSQFMAVVGALLLITDYIVTVALSVSDSYHYLQVQDLFLHDGPLSGVPDGLVSIVPTLWTVIIILILGAINWRGPHFSAKFAGIASASTFVLAGILALLALPYIPDGLRNIGHFNQSIFDVLRNTTGVLLALSGVEAISNMTGIMKNPERTSRRALNIEIVKVVFTTVVLGIAMNGLPGEVVMEGKTENGKFIPETRQESSLDLKCMAGTVKSKIEGKDYECSKRTLIVAHEDMLVRMGEELMPGKAGKVYGLAIGLAYGLLLIFAGNTALIDITNVTYALGRDGELPAGFERLNKNYGVPIWGLVTAVIAPIIVVTFIGSNIATLAALYAIGVVGAVTLNLSGTFMQVKGGERVVVGIGALVMGVLFVTLVIVKMEATIFALIVLIIGLSVRALQKTFVSRREARLIHEQNMLLAK
jgi:amino acid transporter